MISLRSLLAVLAIAVPSVAWGQATLLQGGAWTPGHAPMYVGGSRSQPVVQDSGSAAGGSAGTGLSELGITIRSSGSGPYANAGLGPWKTNDCDYDAPTDNSTGYHFLCMSPNAQGGGLITYGAAGGASQLPLYFILNGVKYEFPGSGNGNVVGPTVSILNDIPCFANTGGALLQDCGISLGSQGENLFLATPSGTSGSPAFRAITSADLATPLGSPPAIGDIAPNSISATTLSEDHLLISNAAPTIASGFGSGSPSPSISANNGTAAFTITIGGTAGATGIIGLPTAANGWNCFAVDLTTNSTGVFITKQTASSATSATLGNFSDVAASGNWVAGDVLHVSCFAY